MAQIWKKPPQFQTTANRLFIQIKTYLKWPSLATALPDLLFPLNAARFPGTVAERT